MAQNNGNGKDFGSFGARLSSAWKTLRAEEDVKPKSRKKVRVLDLIDDSQTQTVEDFRDVLLESYQEHMKRPKTTSFRAQALWYDTQGAHLGEEVRHPSEDTSMVEVLDRVSRLARAHQWFVEVYERDLDANWALIMRVWYEIDRSTRDISVHIEALDPALEHMLRAVMALHEQKGEKATRATQQDRKKRGVVVPDVFTAAPYAAYPPEEEN